MSAPLSLRGLRERGAWLAAAAAVLALDQGIKLLVQARLPLHEPVSVIPGFFRLEHVLNQGGVWGVGGSAAPHVKTLVFLALPVLITALACWYSLQLPAADRVRQGAVALIVGGALGNLVDRLRLHAVIDFVVLYVKEHEWPAFNVADAAICVGVGLLALATLLEREPPAAGGTGGGGG